MYIYTYIYIYVHIYIYIYIIYIYTCNKVQSCKLDNNKYMIASTQISCSEIFALIAVLVFKLLNNKVLFINRKDNRNC